MVAIAICLTGTMFFSGCDDPVFKGKYLVDKIYNYNDVLVAEYFYDKEYRLIKKSVTEHLGNDYKQVWGAYTDEFEYQNGRVSKIKHKDVSYNMFNFDTHFFYNEQGQLIRREVYIDGIMQSYLEFRYDNGRVAGLLNNEDGRPYYPDTLVYDNSGNVAQHISTYPII